MHNKMALRECVSRVLLLRHVTWNRFSLCILMFTVLYNEYLVYLIQSCRWPPIPTKYTERLKDDELVLLLVADPQIQGYKKEMPSILGAITRWDCDRFLYRTYLLAERYARPDIVIFLGDIMDEGSQATTEEYEDYFHRIKNIFSFSKLTKTIFLPGDNDVGGESIDRRNENKTNRFVRHFEPLSGIVNEDFIHFIKMDIARQNMNVTAKKILAKDIASQTMDLQALRIVVNHERVTHSTPGLPSILYQLQPHLIISGDLHRAYLSSCDNCLLRDTHFGPMRVNMLMNIRQYMRIELRRPKAITELGLPPCSYRMGTPNIGYGVAVIGSSGMMDFTVIWSPSRLRLLDIYQSILLFLAVTWCLRIFLRLCRSFITHCHSYLQFYRPSFKRR